MTSSMLDWAINYATLGWKIFPCVPKQKVPACQHGVKDATSDEAQIREWWNRWPDANIAVACGPESGIYVVDVDVQESGIDGWGTIQQFADSGKHLPDTVRQNTPRGGAHFFYRSDVPPNNKNAFCPGIDIRAGGYYVVIAPSIHPNGGTYAWATGKAPWDIGYSEFPDFMRPVTRAPWRCKTTDSLAVVAAVGSGGRPMDAVLENRIREYIATTDPAVQGCGGHNTILRVTKDVIQGFDISEKDAFRLMLEEYNPRCMPPWDMSIAQDHKDFLRKITEANKLQCDKPRGWLRDAELDDNLPSVDISGLLAKMRDDGSAAREEDPAELQYLCQPPGLTGKICSWINATAMKDQPWLTLGCVFAFLGALFGRKVRTESGLRTNLYCMGVALSSAGKAHAPGLIRRLALEAGCLDLFGGDDIASDAAIEQRLEKHPASLFFLDEIGYLLSAIKAGNNQHSAKIIPSLMKLYSAAGNVYFGKEIASREQCRLVQPCCCIYGTSTPDRFTEGVSRGELDDGWLSRCLVFYTRSDPRKRRGLLEQPIPEDIVEQVSVWWKRVAGVMGEGDACSFNADAGTVIPNPTVVLCDSEAEREFEKLDDEAYGMKISEPQFRAIWAKSEENARRIALILAAGDSYDDPRITQSIAEYSCRLVKYLVGDFTVNVAPRIVENKTDQDKQKLLITIESGGEDGITKVVLSRRTQWIDKVRRDMLLRDMIEAELVVGTVVKEEGRGRPSVVYWTADNFIKRHSRQQ